MSRKSRKHDDLSADARSVYAFAVHVAAAIVRPRPARLDPAALTRLARATLQPIPTRSVRMDRPTQNVDEADFAPPVNDRGGRR